MKKLIITWLFLVGLTLLSFFLSEGSLSGHRLVMALMAASIVKFILVGWNFVGLNKAHIAWRTGFAGFILAFATLMLLMY